MYRSMSFAALDPQFSIMIYNYASYKSGKPVSLSFLFTTFLLLSYINVFSLVRHCY